jgi:hypothetical protein
MTQAPDGCNMYSCWLINFATKSFNYLNVFLSGKGLRLRLNDGFYANLPFILLTHFCNQFSHL